MARSKRMAVAPFSRRESNAAAESAGMVQNPPFAPGRRNGRRVLVLEDDGGGGRALEEGGGGRGVMRAAFLAAAGEATTALGRLSVWAHARVGALVSSIPLTVLLVKVTLFYGDVVTDVLSGAALVGACQTGLATVIFVVRVPLRLLAARARHPRVPRPRRQPTPMHPSAPPRRAGPRRAPGGAVVD